MASISPTENHHLLPQQMLNELTGFMDKIAELGERLKLDLSQFQADHIALRINDSMVAKHAHTLWLEFGEQISNAQINGRPIIVLAFNQPLATQFGPIECLELPYPAIGKQYPAEGWEHVEFVVPSHAQTAEQFFNELTQAYPMFAEQCQNLKALGISIKLSSPKGEGERLANPTVAFKYDGVCIKLHPHPLKTIVESEQK